MGIINRIDWEKEDKDRARIDRGDEIRDMISDFENMQLPIRKGSEEKVEREAWQR